MSDADLFAAGSSALEFNAPMAADRVAAITTFVAEHDPAVIADLGCGRGALVVHLLRSLPRAAAIGIDVDETALAAAGRAARAAGVTDRLDAVLTDAASWSGRCDVAITIGATHAWAGRAAVFGSLAATGARACVVADGVWEREPDEWCAATFGELPDTATMAATATTAGWRVEETTRSSLDEWDHFEHAWIDGVRAVGTPEAVAFARRREAEYERYRGVLGFAWLHLTR